MATRCFMPEEYRSTNSSARSDSSKRASSSLILSRATAGGMWFKAAKYSRFSRPVSFQ